MTYALTTPLPFGAGSSLCPPDFEPPCTCPPDGRIDAECPVDGEPTGCEPNCTLDPADDERHEQFGCLTDDDIAELRFKARDYDGWARL